MFTFRGFHKWLGWVLLALIVMSIQVNAHATERPSNVTSQAVSIYANVSTQAHVSGLGTSYSQAALTGRSFLDVGQSQLNIDNCSAQVSIQLNGGSQMQGQAFNVSTGGGSGSGQVDANTQYHAQTGVQARWLGSQLSGQGMIASGSGARSDASFAPGTQIQLAAQSNQGSVAAVFTSSEVEATAFHSRDEGIAHSEVTIVKNQSVSQASTNVIKVDGVQLAQASAQALAGSVQSIFLEINPAEKSYKH